MRTVALTAALAAVFAATAVFGGPSDTGNPPGDGSRRDRLLLCLLAFRQLPADRQARIRELEKALNADDASQARLLAVAERYAAWLARLTPGQRESIRRYPAGPER